MKLKEYKKLDYESFEHIFSYYCNGIVVTGLDNPKTTKADAQYVDWYILLPAIMDEDDRVRLLGKDYQAITKDALSDMRRGIIPVRQYIADLFAKEDAVDIISRHFQKKVPHAFIGANRKRIIDEYWRVIRVDENIPLKYKERFKQRKIAATYEVEAINEQPGKSQDLSALCMFLASVFVFAVHGKKLIDEELALNPIVKQVLSDLSNGKRIFLYALLDSMFTSIVENESDGENYVLKSVNDSEYSDDDYRTVAFELLKYADSIGETYTKVLHALRMFAVNLDQKRAIEIGGMEAADALYKHYGFSKIDYSLLSVDPNVVNAEFDIVLQDGKPAKVIVKRREDGTTDIQVIGKE